MGEEIDGKRVAITKRGTRRTFLHDKLHSFDDKPSFVSSDGSVRKWHRNGRLHREGGKPALIKKVVSASINNKEITSIDKQWFENGKLHSFDDKPNFIKEEIYRNFYKERAVTYKQITKEWLIKGEVLHREGDKPASVVKTFHFKNGQISNKTVHKRWYVRGVLHRDDGKPAFIFNTENIHPDKYVKSYAHEEGLYIRGAKHSVDDKPSHFRHTFSKELDGSVYEDWELEHHRHGQRHREGDKPAILKFEIKEGIKNVRLEEYYLSGEEHRDNGLPSSFRDEYDQTTLRYCVRGRLHRVDEPALIVTKKNSFFYGFYKNDVAVKDCFELFSEILLKKLVSVAPDEFNNVKIGDYPVAQLASILFALTGDKYSSTVLR